MSSRIKFGIFLTIVGVGIYFFLLPHKHSRLLEDITFSQQVFDRNGSLMRLTLSRDDKYRIFTPIDEIPQQLIDAIVLYEDKYFYLHYGVNPISLLKAFYFTYMRNVRKIGGSTITMQTARLKFGINSNSIIGKLYQIAKALYLEFHYSKKEILEAYLNLAPYGGNIEGVTAASLIYFNCNLNELSLIDTLTLAVIPQNPSKRTGNVYNSYDHSAGQYNNAKQARNRLFMQWTQRRPEDKVYGHLLTLPIKFRNTKNLPFIAPQFTLDILTDSHSDNYSYGSLQQNKVKRNILTTINKELQTTIEKQIKLYIDANKTQGIHNAVAMLIDFTTMEVLASVGSSNFFDNDICGQINGVKMHRSPGSTLKPFVYALAFDQSLIHPLTILKDIPTYYDNYKPENFDHSFTGSISAKDSLIKSRNIPVIFLAAKLRNPNFYEFLKQTQIAKLRSPQTYGLSIALGAVEISIEELIQLYAALANLGIYQPLKKIQGTVDGKIIPYRILSKEASFLTLDILKNTPPPRFYHNALLNIPVYWKTGTSSAFKDAVTIGIFGKYVLAVWIGDFKGKSHSSFIGVKHAAPLFFNILSAIKNGNTQDLISNKAKELNITKITICTDTGNIYNSKCRNTSDTWFIQGKSPINPKIYSVDYSNTTHFLSHDLIELYKGSGIHISRECPKGFNTANPCYQQPRITSPLMHSIHSKISNPQIVLSATTDPTVTNVFWFINNRLIANTKPDKSISWQATTGEFIVRIIDNNGKSDAITIYVQD